jgi:hypothetical protein
MEHRDPRTLIVENLSIGVSPELRQAVRQAAQARGSTIAQFVRDALAERVGTQHRNSNPGVAGRREGLPA